MVDFSTIIFPDGILLQFISKEKVADYNNCSQYFDLYVAYSDSYENIIDVYSDD